MGILCYVCVYIYERENLSICLGVSFWGEGKTFCGLRVAEKCMGDVRLPFIHRGQVIYHVDG